MYAWEMMRLGMTKAGAMKVRTATGGSATTVVCSKIVPALEDDALNGGTLLVLRTTDGAAPQGEMTQIVDTTGATGTLTFASGGLTAAPEAGDVFGYCTKEFWPEKLLELANQGLRRLGRYGLVDTSLTTLANTREYDLPASVLEGELVGVELVENANENRYVRVFYATDDLTGKLRFERELEAGKTLRLLYNGYHAELTGASDAIDETVTEELAELAMLLAIREYQTEESFGKDKIARQYEKARIDFEREKGRLMRHRKHPRSRLAGLGGRW